MFDLTYKKIEKKKRWLQQTIATRKRKEKVCS